MNKNYIKLSLISAMAITSLNALEMRPVGFKAVGMGGTGVSSTRGSLSGYYNPALLRFSDYTSEVSLNVGIRARETNLIDPVDELSKLNFQDAFKRIGDNAKNSKLEVEIGLSNVQTGLLKVAGLNGIEIDAAEKLAIENIINNLTGAITISSATDTGGTDSGSISVVDGKVVLVKDVTKDSNGDDLVNSATDIAAIKKVFEIVTQDIGNKNAFQVSVTPSFSGQFSDAFAIGLYGSVDASLKMNISEAHDKLIVEDEGAYYSYDYDNDKYTITTDNNAYKESSLISAINDGTNNVEFKTRVLTEIPISYARAYDWNSGTWSFGASIKPMTLQTTSLQVNLGQSSDDIQDEETDDVETTYNSTFGLDFGVAYIPKNYDMTVGFIAKNINSPKFKVDTTPDDNPESDYKIDPSFRAGVSMPVWNNNLEFALDLDLTKNETFIEGEDSQMLGTGVEFHPVSWFTLRGGVMKDLASDAFDDGTILTTGLGFGAKWIQFDVSGMMSTATNKELPRYTAVNFSLVSKWGDGYNRKSVVASK